jgi:hypothetical protein
MIKKAPFNFAINSAIEFTYTIDFGDTSIVSPGFKFFLASAEKYDSGLRIF